MRLYLSLLLIFFLVGCTAPITHEPVKIGVVSALTGPISTISLPSKNAIELALNDWNSNHETQFEIIYEDNQGKSTPSVNAFHKLVNINKVAAIITDISMTTMTLAPLADEYEIPLVAYLSTSPSVLNAGEYVYRTSPMNIVGMTLIVDYMLKNNQTRVATLTELYDYPVALKKVFEDGGRIEIVASEEFDTTNDLRSIILKLSRENPDAIMIFVQTPNTGLNILKQIKELNLQIPLYGNEHFGTDMALRIDGLEGVITTVPEYNVETIDELKEKYSAAYNEEGILDWLYVATGYDAATVLFEAIEESENIKKHLDGMVDFNGYTGLDEFDEFGDIAQKNYNLLKIENGSKQLISIN